MEKEINKHHVQVPNDMTEQNNSLKPGDLLIYATIKRHMDKDTKTCYPSLNTIATESGASINTVRSSIQNLINTQYIEVTQKGRGKLYKFLKWDKFEPFSYDFLDNKKLSFKEKAYILATQQYMFKNKETQNGIVTYNNIELSKRINTSPSTISRLDSSLREKEFLDINILTQRDQETGLPIREKVFHLSKIEQAIVFILGNHEERIQENTNEIQLLKERMDKLEKENKKLKEELKNKI
jgi:DNA-binding transcriptional regulator YhcF (GntR family)